MKLRTLAAICWVGALVTAAAQTGSAAGPADYPLVRAAVWGQVNKPGLYYLPGSPDLMELLSNAGGPSPGADLSRMLLIRERDGSRTRVNLNRITAKPEPLFLTPGDVVVVPESFWGKVQRNLPVIATVATVVNLVVTITLLTRD